MLFSDAYVATPREVLYAAVSRGDALTEPELGVWRVT